MGMGLLDFEIKWFPELYNGRNALEDPARTGLIPFNKLLTVVTLSSEFLIPRMNDVTGSHSGYDSWIVKLSSTGNIQWQKNASVVQMGTTNILFNKQLTAATLSLELPDRLMVTFQEIMEIMISGFWNWAAQESFNGRNVWADQEMIMVEAIRQTIDGGYIAAGSSDSNDGDVLIMDKATTGWSNLTQEIFNGSIASAALIMKQAYAIQQTTDSGYIVAGETVQLTVLQPEIMA